MLTKQASDHAATTDHIFTFEQLRRKEPPSNTSHFASQPIDFKKAFHTVQHSAACKSLRESAMEEPYIQLFHQAVRQTASNSAHRRRQQTVPRETMQGDPPSTLFFRRLSATHRENLLLRSGTETTTELDVSNTTATRTSPTAGSQTTYFSSAALTTATTAHDPQLHPIQQKTISKKAPKPRKQHGSSTRDEHRGLATRR